MSQMLPSEMRDKADDMVNALGMIGYDAVCLGEKDLAFGPEFLNALSAKYGVPFVCANAVDAKTGKPMFPPYRVVDRNGVKVAFIGVASPERHIVAQVEADLSTWGIRIEDPGEHLAKYVEQMRAESDLIVMLAHTGIETAEFLAENAPVDVIVVGHYPAIANEPREIGDALVVMAGAKADHYGTLEMTLGADGDVESFQGNAIRLLQKGPQVDRIQALFEAQEAREKDARRERQLAQQRERESQQQISQVQAVHERNGIFGAESCKSCHSDTFDRWMETPHATAFATLAEADAWDDPDCIGCHVTGVEDKTFVADVNIAPEVWNVQCEECHGSGARHARDGSYLTNGEATCRKCHDPDNSPEFNYELYSSYGVH